MRYLVIYQDKAFYTDWFYAQNNYAKGMIVFDLINQIFTTDGIKWNEIQEDHL